MREDKQPLGATRPRQRRVTEPQEVSPQAWESYAQRRHQRYSARAKAPPPSYPTLTPRTLAQTGLPAPSGPVRILKRLPQSQSSPIPPRSGKRRRSLWRILGLSVLLLVTVAAISFALTSNVFRVAQVSIGGTPNASLVHSIQHLGIQGQNIFLLDVTALTARIDMIPLVASANLVRQWPNQLSINVVERIPVLLWQTPRGTYSVDNQGVVMAPASETTGVAHLITVVDMRGHILVGGGGSANGQVQQQLHPGDRLNAADIAFALAIVTELPAVTGVTHFTLRYVDRLGNRQANLGGDGSYEVESKAGWLAYLGGPNDANPLDNRLVELQQILALAQQLNVATIDLRFGLRPVYTLKGH